jgi:hypothetical protein
LQLLSWPCNFGAASIAGLNVGVAACRTAAKEAVPERWPQVRVYQFEAEFRPKIDQFYKHVLLCRLENA